MKTKFLVTLALILGSCLGSLFFVKGNLTRVIEQKENKPMSLSKRDRMDLAMQQEFEMTKDPDLGIVPKARLIAANEYLKSMPQFDGPLAGIDWTERGPNNVGGRTRAIMVDPNDVTKKTIWSAGVAGGLWKTTDVTAIYPNWQPVDDFFNNLAISSLAYDPSNSNILYFGTGEGYFNIDAVQGFGVWKSTNGGTTWTQLASTTGTTFNYCQKVVVTSTGVVLVATRSGGVQRSSNGGTSWTKVLGTGLGITGAASDIAYDIEITSTGNILASLSGSVHTSTNGGVSFGSAVTLGISATRIELAVAKSDANYVYALIEFNNIVNGIQRSVNGGTTWAARTEPADADAGIPATDFSRSQGWYNLTVEVDPNNRDVVLVGGIDLFKSTDGAGTWQQISHWYGGFGFQEVHADQHIILFEPGNSSVIYFGNDGGIYRTTNGTAAIPTITSKEFGYNTTQFYGCAMHPTINSDYFLGGTQDNGTQKFTNPGVNSTIEARGGDGCFTHIDQDQPQYQWTSYTYSQYSRTMDGGNSFTDVSYGSTGRFINPTDYDNVNNRFYGAWSSGQYFYWSDPQSGTNAFARSVAAFGGQVSAVTVSPNTANRVFFGIGSNGRIVRVDNASSNPPITGTIINSGAGMPSSGYVSCIEVQNGNDNHLLVTYSNYGVNSVWETTNGGSNWVSVEGNLPDMPIRWALFNPNNSDQALLATELGEWSTDDLNGVSTSWGASNTGLANVRTDMLQIRSSDNLVIAATHGRGLYSSDIFSPVTALFGVNKRVSYVNKSIQFFDASFNATSWQWNFGDGNNSILQNPSHSYTAAGKYTVTLTINSGTDSETKVDYIHILPYGGTPYLPADGGNFEANPLSFGVENINGTPFEKGSSAVTGKQGTNSGSNAWVTGLTSAAYFNDSHSILYTPDYNFTVAGTYIIRFYSRFNTEANYDGFRVEYSTNRGDTWNMLGTAGANWYNWANNVEATAFPINEPYFSGNFSSSFVQYFTNISFLAGNSSVTFRFVFKSDYTVTGPGVAIDDFQIDGPPNNPLPVELVLFTGSFANDQVVLNWQTKTEVNNYGFEILRSSYNSNAWVKIGFVVGHGNSNSPKFYSFADTDLNGLSKVKYKLKQIDTDGAFEFSDEIEIDITPIVYSLEQNYPNPFNPVTTIKFSIPQREEVRLTVYNILGEQVESLINTVLEPGNYSVKFNAGAYTSCVYLYKLEAGEFIEIRKMLLVK